MFTLDESDLLTKICYISKKIDLQNKFGKYIAVIKIVQSCASHSSSPVICRDVKFDFFFLLELKVTFYLLVQSKLL